MSFGLEAILLHGKHRRETRRDRITRGIILLIACVAAMIVLALLTRRAIRRSRWAATPCQMIFSGVDVAEVEGPAPYQLSVTYVYQRHHVARSSSSYSDGGLRSSDAAEVYAVAASLPAGTQRTCFVDPADPGQALLVLPNPRWWEAGTAAVSLLTVLLIVFYCVPQITHPVPPPRPGAAPPGEWVFLSFLVIACAAGLGWACVVPLMRNASAAVWMRVPATVEHARCIFEEMHGEVPITVYRTDLLYRYDVAGVTYHSNRYSLTEIESPLPAGRRRRVAELAAMPRLFCYVDPQHPDQAVLTRAVSPTQVLSVWFALAGVLGVWALVPRARRASLDASLRRSRWTIGVALVLLLGVSVVGLILRP